MSRIKNLQKWSNWAHKFGICKLRTLKVVRHYSFEFCLWNEFHQVQVDYLKFVWIFIKDDLVLILVIIQFSYFRSLIFDGICMEPKKIVVGIYDVIFILKLIFFLVKSLDHHILVKIIDLNVLSLAIEI